jgi:RHS repeat-associated protein
MSLIGGVRSRFVGVIVSRYFATGILILLASFLPVTAQTGPQPGIVPFSTQAGGPYDSIDMSTGSIMFFVPVRTKAGKTSFSFKLVGSSSGASYGTPNPHWTTGTTFGGVAFGGSLGATVRAPYTSVKCNNNTTGYSYSYSVADGTGAVHPFPGNVNWACGFGGGTGIATDGSGYTLNTTAGPGATSAILYDASGNTVTSSTNYSTGATTKTTTDPDGVTMSAASSFNSGETQSTTAYTDTLGEVAMTYTTSFGAETGEPDTYTYTDVNGNTQTFQVNYSSYTLQTAFGCTGVAEEGPIQKWLPSSINTPIGNFTISYETTPGYSGNGPDGPYATGRVAQLTYPTGGYVSYAYSGGNNGINCNSQVVPTLTRTVHDNYSNQSSVWTYANTNNSNTFSNFTVTVKDPATNQTVYSFADENQTQAAYYQGSASGTPLKNVITCYNGATTNCVSLSGTPGLPITETDVYTSLNGSSSNRVKTTYDSYGNVTAALGYDFGGTTPLSSTYTSYGQSWSSSSGPCTPYSSGYVSNTPCYSHIENSAGTDVAKTQITYGSTGHPTTTQKWTSGSSSLTSTATYNSNGTVATSTDVNGAVSTYAYNGTGGCNNLLPTSVSVAWTGPPAGSLTTGSTQWNCIGGVATQTADANGTATGKATTYTYNDPLWRINSMTDPMGDVTNYYYPSPTQSEAAMNFATTSTVDRIAITDGLGRPVLSQQRQKQGVTTFDTTSTSYGWTTGVGAFVTVSPPGIAATRTQYDALGRTLSVTDGGNGTTSYQYIQNDVLQTVGPSPTFQKQYQYNGIGQLTSVCEVNALPGSGTCTGQTNAESGYLTTYSYDPLGNILGVNEAGQTRTYHYDGLSRLTYEQNPESGVTQYFWDAAPSGCGSGGWSTPGDIGAKEDSRGIYNCYLFDGLHRLLGVGSAGVSLNCRGFFYDSPHGTPPSGITVQNTAGHLVEAYTNSACNGTASLVADEWFSYDLNDRNTDVYESTPNSGGYYHTTVGYWANNTVNTLGGVPTLSGWTYVPDGEGRPYSATYNSSTPIDWVTSATYYPTNSSSPPQGIVTFGNGDSDVYSIDSTTGRMSGYQFTMAGSTPETLTGVLNWNANWTLGSMGITDGFNAANTQTCTYSHDALSRISSVGCVNSAEANIWGTNYTFDPFGNITKTVPTNDTGNSFQPTYSTATNQYTLSGCTVTYDADGHLTNDCFNTYTWDVYGDPITVNSKTITYDALGREVEIGSGSSYTQILYSPIGKLGLMNGQSVNSIRFPLPGGSMAEDLEGSNRHTLHSDWLGTSRLSTTWAHGLAYDVAYSPYGEAYVGSGSTTTEVNFTGMRQDTQTGLYDFSAREYSTVGRWISPDPSGLSAVDPTNPQSWNRYAYVLNNPLSFKDPTGLECVWDDGSFDSADDPDTGSAGGCGSAGGTYVEPDLFENAMLTSGQWNSNFGDWSGSANANLAQNWVVSSGGVNADAIDPNSILSSLSSDLSYGLNFTRSFFGGFTVNVGRGSCLGVAASGFTSAASAAQSAASNVQKYAPVLIQAANPGNASAVSGALYFTGNAAQQMGAPAQDVAAYTIAAGAVGSIASGVSTLGQSALSALRNPYALAFAVEGVAAYGVYKEGVAAYRGQCTF